jgi:hypothetical protein
MLIGGGDSMKGEVWIGHVEHLGEEVVQQIYDGVEHFYPVVSQNRGLKEQGAQHIINGVKDTLGFTVLR